MGAETDAHTAGDWAGYIVDGLRNGTLETHYRGVFKEYLDYTQSADANGWTPDMERLSRYLHSDHRTAESAAEEDTYWRWLEADMETFLTDTYATDDGTPAQPPASDPDDATVDRIYAPGARAINNTAPTAADDDTWMTTIYAVYDDENEDAYIAQTAYADEDEARNAVRWLIDDGQTAEVTELIWKSIRYNYPEPMRGFIEELAAAGEIEQAEELRDEAEKRQYTDEAEQIQAIIDTV